MEEEKIDRSGLEPVGPPPCPIEKRKKTPREQEEKKTKPEEPNMNTTFLLEIIQRMEILEGKFSDLRIDLMCAMAQNRRAVTACKIAFEECKNGYRDCAEGYSDLEQTMGMCYSNERYV